MKELVGDECFNKLDEKGYILFYFGASWCKPCQEILPLMEDLKSQYDPNLIQFYKIDIDENEELSSTWNIKSVPTFYLLHKNNLLGSCSGADITKINELLLMIKK